MCLPMQLSLFLIIVEIISTHNFSVYFLSSTFEKRTEPYYYRHINAAPVLLTYSLAYFVGKYLKVDINNYLCA